MTGTSASDPGAATHGASESLSTVDLLWIPLGAGTSVPTVRWSGRAYEALVSARERRERLDLYHAALELSVDGDHYVVEMTPAWGPAHQPHAVASGPVGMRPLGRFPLFRYEVHCTRDGVIPDRDHAVTVHRVSQAEEIARRALALAPRVPTATWGRDELGTGEMWNSNSVVAWVLSRAGAVTADLAPPAGGRAPGWRGGLEVAERR